MAPLDTTAAKAKSTSLDNFATIPQTTLPGGLVVPAFRVSKFLASAGENRPILLDGSGSPMVDVTYHQARELAAQAGFELIKESQALSLAWNLSQVARNWISGTVGDGDMYQGLHLDLDDVDEVYPFNFVSPDARERRNFVLADGSEVMDPTGNAYSWVFDDIQGDKDGIIARAFAADSPSITTAPFPSRTHGIGWQPGVGSDWSSGALVRGGYWCSGSDAGVFRLNYVWPDGGRSSVGFRCTTQEGL